MINSELGLSVKTGHVVPVLKPPGFPPIEFFSHLEFY